MNKIYKLVWSKVRNAWVVTSEIAKGHGKDSSSGRNKNMLKAGGVMTLLGGFMTAGIFPVAAELTADQKAVYDAVMEEMNQKVEDSAVKYYGVNDTAVSDTELGWEHIVIYDGKKELNADLPDKNIHGEGVQDNKGDGVKRPNYGSMAAGYNAYTSHGFSTALGNETVAYTNSLAAGFASYARAESVALGVNAFAKNRSEAIGQYARADQEAIAIGYKATAGAFNRGEQTDKLPQSITGIAIGKEAYARGGMAFGNGAESLELHAMAFGVNAKSVGSGVALGYQAQANVSGGIAIGMNSRADVGRNIKGYLAPADIDGKAAAEKRTWISGGSAVSFGNIQMARQLTNVAAGTEDTDAVNVAQLKALNTKVDNGAIHYFHVNSDDKNAPEGTNYNNDGATGKDAIAIGKNAVSEGDGSIAIGKGAKIFNTSQSLGMAIGDGAEAAHGSIVIGKNAKDYDTNPKQGAFGIFIGSQAKSFGGSSQTVIGNYGQAKGEDSTAIGTRAQALGGESLSVGSSAKSLGQGAASFGTDSIAEFDESTALGSYANGRGNKSVASGNKSVAAGHNSVAIGYQSFAHNGFIDEDEYKALSPEEQKKYFEASGLDGYFLKDTADGNDAEKIGDTYLNTAVGSYSRAYKQGTTLGGMTSAQEEGTAIGTYAKAYKKGAASLGYKAKANVENGVALGAYSFADREKGSIGYVLGGDNSTLEKALESIGQKEKYDELTGKIDPLKDEYNGLLKAYQDAPAKSAEETTAKQKLDEWKANHPDFLPAVQAKKQMTDAWQSGNGAVSVGRAGATRQITNVAAGTQDTDAVNVAQLKALNTKMDQGAIHYYSVTSDKKAAGSNFDNDGAKAADSMVIGIGSTSEAPNSTVLGNNNTLKRHITDKNGSSSLNNIVVGQSLEVEGAHNAVFGTDYQNGPENRKTMAAGKNNTVIGVGNLAGYTAEKDPQDQFKWIYSKVEDGADSQNVVVGINNTATRGSVVIGAGSEATSSGISVGRDNKVLSDEDYGLALGNYLTVDGYQSVAIGSESKATANYATAIGQEAMAQADYTTAIGKGAVAEQEDSIAFGDAAKAQNKYSVAFGSFAKATARSGVAIGSSSLADREKGAIGYLAGEETSEVWKATQGAVSVGNKEKKYTRQITGVAAGTEDTDAVNVAQLKALNTKVDKGAIHYFSVKSDDSANPAGTNWNNDGATGQDAVAIGKNAAASGKSAFATGWKSKAAGYSDIAIGREAEATGGWGVAIGQSAKAQASTAVAMAYAAEAKGSNSLAIGVQSEAKTNDSTAYGREAKALGDVALAVGAKTKAEGNHSSVFGYEATTDSTAWNGTAIGRGAYIGKQAADGTTPDVGVSNNYYTPVDDDTAVEAGKETMNSTAVGFGAKSFGYQNTALGAGAEAFDTNTVAVGVMSKAIGHYANAFGKQARAEGTNSTAIGHFARALGESSMALGDYAITSTLDGKGKVNRSVALGSHARVAADNSLALGYNSLANIADDVDTEAYLSKEAFKKENGVVSVGNSEYTIGDETIAQNYRRITNVAGGAADNDAVNVAQLKVVNKKADQNATDITNLKNTVNANGKATKVTVDGEENSQDGNLKIKKTDTDGQLTYDLSLNDEITIGKDGKDGKIGINGKDGISADITVGKGEAGVDGKDGITRIIYKDEKGNHHEVATLDDGLKFKGDAGDVVIRKLNTQLDIKGGAKAEDLSDDNIGVVGTAGDNGGMAVKLSKKLKGLTSAEFKDGDNITNITAENVTITRKEGKVDLWELNKTVNNITAGTTDVSSWKLQANGANERVIKKDSVVNFKNGTNTEVTVNGNDITVDLNAATQKQINDNTTSINNIDKRVTTIENNIDQKIEGARITVEGDTTTGVKATEVKTGDKVTGYKVSLDNKVTVGNVAIDGKDGKGEITGLTNTTVDAADFATKGRAATEEQLKAAMGKVQAQGRTTVKGSNNITVTPKTPNAAEYTVELAKDISVNSVTANEYKVGGTTYINKDGINANGKKITNVADGVVSKDSKDAVNGSQLFATNQQVFNNMNQINNLREESREGDALGAAMAALKPLDFDPYQRSQVMAGVGYYRGKEAVALGLAHYKNEDLMFHGGLAYAGNSELMANVGVSYRFGSKDDRDIKHDRNLRMPQYAEGPISSVYILQDEVDRLTKENKEANDRIAALEAKLEKVLEKVK